MTMYYGITASLMSMALISGCGISAAKEPLKNHIEIKECSRPVCALLSNIEHETYQPVLKEFISSDDNCYSMP